MINAQTKVCDLTVSDLESILLNLKISVPPETAGGLLDSRQARALMGEISAATLYYRCVHNKIPHIRQGRRLYFFKDVLAELKREGADTASMIGPQKGWEAENPDAQLNQFTNSAIQ